MTTGNLTQLIFPLLLVVAFYFLLIRPQQQQRKAQAQMVASLTQGARILTVGGIYATIVEVEEDRLLVEVADGSQMEIAKRAVGTVLPAESAELDEDDSEPEMADDSSEASEQLAGDSKAESSDD